jgi:hypothetical protein
VNLVIPYKDDAADGHELRYCLRSMQQHFADLTSVLLIGEKPTWYTGEHMTAEDKTTRKEYNIVSKVILSPYENFLLCSDDVYALRLFDVSLPYYYSGLLRTTKRYGRVGDRVKNTCKLYPEGKLFDIHTPMVINRDKFREAHNINWLGQEFLTKSIYCNYLNIEGVQLADHKIREGNKIPDAPFFSTNDRTAKRIKFEELYPNKSRYESN